MGIEWPSMIIGAILGVVIPGLGKLLLSLFKRHKDKYHLSLIRGETSTYSSMSEGDVSVNIQYKGEDYTGVLSILEISLENDGLNSISFANHFEKPIMICSNAYKIVDVQDISKDKIKANVTLSEDGTVQLTWGLLKKDERVTIRLVGEYTKLTERKKNERTTFYDSLSFSVRSDCVDYITPRGISFKYLVLMSFFACSLAGVSHYWALENKDVRDEAYSFNYEGEIITGNLQYDEATNIYTISQPDNLVEKNLIFDFNSYPKIIHVRSSRTFIIIFYSVIWLLMLMFFALVVALKKKRINKKVFED